MLIGVFFLALSFVISFLLLFPLALRLGSIVIQVAILDSEFPTDAEIVDRFQQILS